MEAEETRAWRVAQINMEERPFAIIRHDGPHGDEFVCFGLSERIARMLCSGRGGLCWQGPHSVWEPRNS